MFRWARSVDPVQPLTSGVWNGSWGDPGSRSTISGIQLDNADVITFHSYGAPADFEARIAELSPLGRPIVCTDTWPGLAAVLLRESYQLPSGTTLVHSTGV